MPNKPHTLDEIILRALMTAPNNMQEIVINDKPITVFEVQNYKILTASILDWVEREIIGEDETAPQSETGIDLAPIVGTKQRNNLKAERRAKLNKEREGNDE